MFKGDEITIWSDLNKAKFNYWEIGRVGDLEISPFFNLFKEITFSNLGD